MRKNVLLIKILKLFFVIILLGLIIFSSFTKNKIYFLLSKTSLYDTISLSTLEHGHDEDNEEEGQMAYFESEFNLQPYANPLPSSVELIQLSTFFFIFSLVLNNMGRRKVSN